MCKTLGSVSTIIDYFCNIKPSSFAALSHVQQAKNPLKLFDFACCNITSHIKSGSGLAVAVYAKKIFDRFDRRYITSHESWFYLCIRLYFAFCVVTAFSSKILFLLSNIFLKISLSSFKLVSGCYATPLCNVHRLVFFSKNPYKLLYSWFVYLKNWVWFSFFFFAGVRIQFNLGLYLFLAKVYELGFIDIVFQFCFFVHTSVKYTKTNHQQSKSIYFQLHDTANRVGQDREKSFLLEYICPAT